MENSIPERLKPNFTSHIVQIKHTQPQSQKSNSNGLYIPHSSDKTVPTHYQVVLLLLFTSHIVQIKRGQGEAAKAAKALYIPHSSDKTRVESKRSPATTLYIPHSSDKTMMVLSKEVGISTLHPT